MPSHIFSKPAVNDSKQTLTENKPGVPIRDITTEDNKHKFASGATSSEQIPMYHLITPSFILKTAQRFTVGYVKHGDVNYQKCVWMEDDKTCLDVEFARDRFNHGLHHLLNLKKTGNSKDDNIGAVAWFLSFASWVEEFGFDWQRILNPAGVREKVLVLSADKKSLEVRY